LPKLIVVFHANWYDIPTVVIRIFKLDMTAPVGFFKTCQSATPVSPLMGVVFPMLYPRPAAAFWRMGIFVKIPYCLCAHASPSFVLKLKIHCRIYRYRVPVFDDIPNLQNLGSHLFQLLFARLVHFSVNLT
jgi:hypothetical protein